MSAHKFFIAGLALALGLTLTLGQAPPCQAQEDGLFLRALGPRLGNMKARVQYEGEYAPEADVDGQQAEFGYTLNSLSVQGPVWQNDHNELAMDLSAEVASIDTEARLPDSGAAFPDDLYDLRLSTMYRMQDSDGWIWGGLLSVGSPSDEPFNSYEETNINLSLLLRLPRGEKAAWLFFLSYDNNRELLEGAPLPGIGYWYTPNRQLMVAAGLPFFFVNWRPVDQFGLTLRYFALRNVKATLSYYPARGLELFGGFSWRHDSYMYTKRRNTSDRLQYYEKRGFAGLTWRAAGFRVTAQAAHSFDRQWFEGEDLDDEDNYNEIDLDSGMVYSVKLSYRF